MKFKLYFPALRIGILLTNYAHGSDVKERLDFSDRDDGVEKENPHMKQGQLSISEFQNLLYTEVNDEMEAIKETLSNEEDFLGNGGRKLHDEGSFLDTEDLVWEHILTHAWFLSKSVTKLEHAHNDTNSHSGLDSRLLSLSSNNTNDAEVPFPFLVCSRTPLLQSGVQRLAPMLQFTGAQLNDAIVISNDDHQSCFQISTTFKKASILDSSIGKDEYVIVPMADIMKISMNTFKQTEEKNWAIPTPDERIRLILNGDENKVEWERIVRIGLAPGLGHVNENDMLTEAHAILDDVKQMGRNGSLKNRRHLVDTENMTNPTPPDHASSISDLFSFTSTLSITKNNSRRLETVTAGRQWSRSLQGGIESAHFCRTMFDNIEIRHNSNMQVFDIVLNPHTNHDKFMKQNKEDAESSASNRDCVSSLFVGLSVHPHVLSIEADQPISFDDYESQCITQSNLEGRRPLFDRGLTGAGQIVSVTDSGLDINHKHFGPTSDDIFKRWVTTERKIVRYDHSKNGDKIEQFQGHGTRVAGVIAGNAGDDADGIARDAKIHMWDLNREGQMASPGPEELFSSIYNNGKGAKITNGSWSSGYQPYTFRCRMFDSSLRDNYDDILFVASAGNAGNDVPGKVKNTIGDPSSCKNILSVGASQSYGKRLFYGDKGKDYLADFSSRGPTADGRMKPDIVAPGYKILAPRAHAKANNYDETYETFGTSFSAPVVAGNAALIRQYFEEAWFPCGKRGCNKNNNYIVQNPSGSLVKAILMNGAIQSIQNVQKLPGGQITESVREYDNNAGMGLINMANSLPLEGVNDMDALAVNNRSINDGDLDYIIIKTKANSCANVIDSLRVTLSWYDPPGANGCVHCLINDLDLVVEKMSGSRVEKTYYPNGSTRKDTKNNVERVRVNRSNSETLKITVRASNLATRNQKYSLIMTGCFEIVEIERGLQCVSS